MNDTLLETALRWWESFGGAAASLTRITFILLGAWVLVAVLQRAIRTLRERLAARMDDRESAKRAETLGRVFRYLVAVVVSAIAGMLVLAELGVSVAPILGAAGVVGLAVGFGAQSLVKDFFTGFFILLEDQIRQGDVVQLGSHSGVVEVVTLRFVQLRDYNGNVHYVPNGHITTVVNMTRGFSHAVMDIGVAYRENVDHVTEVMRDVATQMRDHPDYQDKITADLEVAGVEQWGDSAVVIRCRFRTLPMEQWGVRREYLRRLKAAFDAKGIEIPYPHLTVYAGQDKAGNAPAFALQQLVEA
ncbi:MAG: mechanosensitive ion channel family protein [Hydrogenophaga sp.]|jgi:small conductance mechanosensitive channel|nr:mechanosensitive ion channel family protein [Hydrogenophaga sp.]